MAAIDTLTPAAVTVVKIFAFPFRSAPTADLVLWGVNQIATGSSPSTLLDLLFEQPVPNSPFSAYSSISTIAAFATALVDHLSVGTNVDTAVKASWRAEIQAAAPAYATRGALTWAVIQYIDGYSGSNADLRTLKANLADRVELAAAFAQSPAGSVWDRMGFDQLLAPLEQPGYALSTQSATVDEGTSAVFSLQTTNVAAGTTFPYLLSGTGIDNVVFGVLTGTVTVDMNGRATATIPILVDGVTEGPETLRLTLGDNLAHAEVTVREPIAQPTPTYTLRSSVNSVEETGTITYTLTTTNVSLGTAIPYVLSGTGITATDIEGGLLAGSIIVNAAGLGVLNVTIAADGAIEAPEVLRLTLVAGLEHIETTILDMFAPPSTPTYKLTANVDAVEEAGTVTYTLTTTNVSPGTAISYVLSGSGITAADIEGGVLAGSITVNAAGLAVLNVTIVADGVTETPELLRLTLGTNLAAVETTIRDATTPPPTYTLTANVNTVEEAGTVTYTLTTTNVSPGTAISYVLSGSGITAADIEGGVLAGSITVNAAGLAVLNVTIVADGVTETPELLRLTLGTNLAAVETTIRDSNTPPPTSGPDTRVINDSMNLPGAGVPATPAAGEIRVNSYLTYDLLDQSGSGAVRMNLAALKASQSVAGTLPDPTNFKADRGNLPQISNQSLFVVDLLAGTDRVDYSAETGRIVAPISAEAPAGTQYILVNDNGTDNAFNSASDRMDELRNVEQIVASAGGGVLDLTASGQAWKITFSRSFSTASDVTASLDRATHRVELLDLATSTASAGTFYEFRDAGTMGSVTQAAALWSTVQGSDRDETLIFSPYQSTEARSNVLRGGTNRVEYNTLATSIVADLALTPWVASVNPADVANASGRATATITFTNGDGVTPLSPNTSVTSSHTPDNKVAAGKLIISATGDSDDAVTFVATPQSKWIELGLLVSGNATASARLVSATGGAAVEFQRFEQLRDNGASDDVYDVKGISRATTGSLRLSDSAGADHDTVRLAMEALGTAAVGGSSSTVNLATLNGPAPGFGFDFDVLDLSAISGTALSVIGTAGSDDELVAGALVTIAVANQFESLVLTNASMDKGTTFVLDLDTTALWAGGLKIFTYTGSALSAGGLALGTPGQTNPVAPVTTALNMSILDSSSGAGGMLVGGSGNDTLAGGAGNDTLRGGGGNDAVDAGLFTETWTFNLRGTTDAVASTSNRIVLTMTIDGTVLTMREDAIADTSYGDGNGAVVDGAGGIATATAAVALINANLAAINAGPGSGTLSAATYNAGTGNLVLLFNVGVNVNDTVTFTLNKGADTGRVELFPGVNVNGGGGGADRIVFEASAVANGRDTITNFVAGSDKLDFTAFTGGAITAARPAINAATGGTFAGISTTAELVFNKAGALLAASDFATAAAAGKFVIADGTRCVVAVTADPTGAAGDAANTAVSFYYVTNGAAVGISDIEVTLVGTVSGASELTLSSIALAMA